MANYIMILQYDGTRYNGWQKQGNTGNTIQEKLEAALCQMSGEEIAVIGSGRTDAGAHAMGQAANFHMNAPLTADDILNQLNYLLPKDIGVLFVREADPMFHSRHHAKYKLYQYRCRTSPIPNVFEKNYYFHYRKPLSVEKMRQGARYLVGKHDFKAFCSNKRYKKSTIRIIYNIEIKEKAEEIYFYFKGNGFLYNMVRILVGTLMDVGEGKCRPEDVLSILHGKNREAAGVTVPACGLTLLEVGYDYAADD